MKKCFKSSVTCVDVINWYQHCSDQTSVLASRLLRSPPTLSVSLTHSQFSFSFRFPLSVSLPLSLSVCHLSFALPSLSSACSSHLTESRCIYGLPKRLGWFLCTLHHAQCVITALYVRFDHPCSSFQDPHPLSKPLQSLTWLISGSQCCS